MLKDKLESHPWVQGAEVNENWNSGIVTVQVEERRPVLDAEVDGRRFVLSADGEELPGPGGAEPREGGVGSRPGRGDLGVREDVAQERVEARLDRRGWCRRASRPRWKAARVIFSGDVGDGQAMALEDTSCPSIPTPGSSTCVRRRGWSSAPRHEQRDSEPRG